jgi:hypothetical protein
VQYIALQVVEELRQRLLRGLFLAQMCATRRPETAQQPSQVAAPGVACVQVHSAAMKRTEILLQGLKESLVKPKVGRGDAHLGSRARMTLQLDVCYIAQLQLCVFTRCPFGICYRRFCP